MKHNEGEETKVDADSKTEREYEPITKEEKEEIGKFLEKIKTMKFADFDKVE